MRGDEQDCPAFFRVTLLPAGGSEKYLSEDIMISAKGSVSMNL
jgi:hypothetical protein